VRAAARVDELYGDEPAPEAIVAALDALYPAGLAEQRTRLRELSEEHALLRALQRGILEAPGGVVRHRGQEHRRREVPRLIAELERELSQVREALASHDRRVRTAHLAAARTVSPRWEAYLRGVLAIHHYIDHRRADLEDAVGALQNTFAVVTADGRVSADEHRRLIAAADVVYSVLHDIHAGAEPHRSGAPPGFVGSGAPPVRSPTAERSPIERSPTAERSPIAVR
jgi:hypothetical protein